MYYRERIIFGVGEECEEFWEGGYWGLWCFLVFENGFEMLNNLGEYKEDLKVEGFMFGFLCVFLGEVYDFFVLM